MFFFQLRKDLYNKNNQSLLVKSVAEIKNTGNNINIARNYVNSINSTLEKKVDSTEVFTILNNYYGNGNGGGGSYDTSQIINLINNAGKKAIDDITSATEKYIYEVKEFAIKAGEFAERASLKAKQVEELEKKTALSAIMAASSATASASSESSALMSSAAAALSVEKATCQARKAEEFAERVARQAKQVEESAERTSDQARKAEESQISAAASATSAAASATSAAASESAAKILSSSISETAAEITIAIYNNINLNKELLEKIEYLFQFFYHSDSSTIMENYPII
jgi:hypothetical protein